MVSLSEIRQPKEWIMSTMKRENKTQSAVVGRHQIEPEFCGCSYIELQVMFASYWKGARYDEY